MKIVPICHVPNSDTSVERSRYQKFIAGYSKTPDSALMALHFFDELESPALLIECPYSNYVIRVLLSTAGK